MEPDIKNYLKVTKYIDHDHHSIKQKVGEIIKDCDSDEQKAVLIHDFVRDNILFGFNQQFYDMIASDVLKVKRGFCNNKSTLFVAMLRAANIPARTIFVDISKEILNGIVDPQSPYVDHSYTEVFLNNKWIKVDSYIVDSKLFQNAKKKLAEENGCLGYGVNSEGVNEWNGKDDAFSQFVLKNSSNYSTREYGIFDDVNHFYSTTKNTWSKSNLITKTIFFLLSNKFNKNIEKIRLDQNLIQKNL